VRSRWREDCQDGLIGDEVVLVGSKDDWDENSTIYGMVPRIRLVLSYLVELYRKELQDAMFVRLPRVIIYM
jgi:hypothetical protein